MTELGVEPLSPGDCLIDSDTRCWLVISVVNVQKYGVKYVDITFISPEEARETHSIEALHTSRYEADWRSNWHTANVWRIK